MTRERHERHRSEAFIPIQDELDAAYRFYGRMTSDLITISDRAGHLLHCNPVAERVFGCSPEEAVGRSLFAFVHPEDRAEVVSAFERWNHHPGETSFLVECRMVSLREELRHLQWTVTPYRQPDGEVRCLIAHARDVTGQVQWLERVKRSDRRHSAVLLSLLDPMMVIDGHGTVLEVSRSVQEVFGYTPEELLGKNIKLLMPEPHRSQHDSYLERYRTTGETWILNRTRRFEVVRKDGARIQVELSVSRVDVPGEEEPCFVGSFRDVTARLQAEGALAESEARLRAIFDQEFQFVGLLARDGRMLEVNASALRSTGARRSEVVGRHFWDTPWWKPGDAQRLKDAVQSAARGEFVRFEVESLTASGTALWVDFSLKPVKDAQGVVQFLLPEGRDITAIKHSHQRELAMQDALAAIGESASVLAHEIKNPLTAVNLALRAVADKLGEDQKVVLEDLAERLRKLERTMRRTLSFARPLELEPEACDLAAMARDVLQLLAPELADARIAHELVLGERLPPVQADRGLIEEVLTNLVRNAREALGSRGGRVRVSVLRESGQVLVRVEDDGEGIVPSVKAEIFKPFVTSKKSGTGLGLAIARKVVREHGGEIGVGDSNLGGACFWFRLPVEREAMASVEVRSGHEARA